MGRIVLIIFMLSGFASAISSDSLRLQAVAEGYWRADVDSSEPALLAKGPLFKVRRIEIRDSLGRPLDGFSINGFVGAAASRKNIEALQSELRKRLLNTGFPFAVIEYSAAADSSGQNFVDLDILIQRGDAYKIGGVQLMETRTNADVALRMALWQIGDAYNEEKLDLGLKRLRRTGYFESAELAGLFRDSTRNLIYPALRLPDLQGNRLSGLLGYDSKAGGEGLTGYIDMHLINVFGTARDFDFNFDNRAGNEREVKAVYVEPWLLNLPLGVRLEAGFLQLDTLFWEWNRSVILFEDLNFTSRLEVELGDQENRDLILDFHTHAIRSGLKLIFDNRDRVPLTVSGYRAEVGVAGLHRDTSGGSYYLAQGSGAVESWLPFNSRLGVRLGLRAANNYPLNHINHGELFFVGGANSLRGYQEREFSTNAYVLSQVELQTWLGRRGRVFAFTDPGLVNRLAGTYSFRPVLGYGVGVELSKGDWSVSLSYALSLERDYSNGLLHIGLDNRF